MTDIVAGEWAAANTPEPPAGGNDGKRVLWTNSAFLGVLIVILQLGQLLIVKRWNPAPELFGEASVNTENWIATGISLATAILATIVASVVTKVIMQVTNYHFTYHPPAREQEQPKPQPTEPEGPDPTAAAFQELKDQFSKVPADVAASMQGSLDTLHKAVQRTALISQDEFDAVRVMIDRDKARTEVEDLKTAASLAATAHTTELAAITKERDELAGYRGEWEKAKTQYEGTDKKLGEAQKLLDSVGDLGKQIAELCKKEDASAGGAAIPSESEKAPPEKPILKLA